MGALVMAESDEGARVLGAHAGSAYARIRARGTKRERGWREVRCMGRMREAYEASVLDRVA